MHDPHSFSREVFPPFRRRRRIAVSVIAVILGLLILPQLVTLRTDWLWYGEIGYLPVFITSLAWRAGLFVGVGVVAFGFVYLNVRRAAMGPFLHPSPMLAALANAMRGDVARLLPRVLALGSAIVALATASAAAADWMTFVMAARGGEVGQTDALFGRDLGVYLFRLPAYAAVLNGGIAILVVTLLATIPLYAMRGAFGIHGNRLRMDHVAERHIGALTAFFFLLLAVRLWFVTTAQLLYSTTGPLVGASYTDVHVALPGIRVAAFAALLTAGLAVYGIVRRSAARLLSIGVLLYVVVSLVGRGLLPFAVQRLVVIPNELDRETPYLRNHLEATRQAWALDRVTTRDLTGEAELTMADIRANTPTIENVRLWERDLVEQSFAQIQEIRTYYDFVSVTDDRYTIDGKYRQVHVAARELNSNALPTRTFINERLTFTHGMGLTMAPVNQVTAEGLPLLFIKDLPPVSSVSLRLTRPQIYYGQLTSGYVFVGTNQDEFDYPAGEANSYTRYAGSGGVRVGSFWRRALFAWRFGSLRIMLSDNIADDARILYWRNIDDRARMALPFLRFDAEPYLVVSDSGHMKWMMDAYTRSTTYPYSQRANDGINYMRNSVKVVIDAYNGTVDAYVADSTDALIAAMARIFPGIFKPLDAMPADLRAHVRYPGELFRAQAVLQTTYHMLEPSTFYHREDQWQIPAQAGREGRGQQIAFMRHIIMRLPGEVHAEFIYMTPFTPRGKDNLAAWMVARMDGAHYGELIVYRFPKQSLVYGPRQVANRINQNTDISQQITLWDQRGSEVIRGELLVIPIEESLIYVQPLFLRAQGGTIPELKRVIVAHGTRVVMEETLDAALSRLFGGRTGAQAPAPLSGPGTETSTARIADLLQQAQQHYDRAISAQRSGNWAEYGREIEALGAVIRQLRNQRNDD
jgi:uncharacterized membrane protein (UPF0182 family)